MIAYPVPVKWRHESWRLLLLAVLFVASGYGGMRAGFTLFNDSGLVTAFFAMIIGGALAAASACFACGMLYSRLDAREQRNGGAQP